MTTRPRQAEHRLGHPGVGDGRLLRRTLGRGEGGGRVEQSEPRLAEGQALLEPGEGDQEVSQHPGALGALAGVEEGHRGAGAGRLGVGEEDAVVAVGARGGDHELVGQVGDVVGHHGGLHGAATGRAHRGRQVAEAMSATVRVVGADAGDHVIVRSRQGNGAVLVPTNTNFATAAAVLHAGGRVRFVDMDAASFAPSLAQIEAAIAQYRNDPAPLAGVMWVHIGGVVSADFPAVVELCRRHGLFVFEDSAHAHGSSLGGTRYGGTGRRGRLLVLPDQGHDDLRGRRVDHDEQTSGPPTSPAPSATRASGAVPSSATTATSATAGASARSVPPWA